MKTHSSGLCSGPEASESWSPDHLTYYGEEHRAILLTGSIDTELAAGVISQIKVLGKTPGPIFIYMNTPGGSVVDALSIYDEMLAHDNEITVIVNGFCYSAGLIILSGAEQRYATRHSRFLYHPPIAYYSVSSQDEVSNALSMYRWCKKSIDKILRARTGLKKKKFLKMFGNTQELEFGVGKALKCNIIDSVVTKYRRPEPNDNERKGLESEGSHVREDDGETPDREDGSELQSRPGTD